MYTCNIFFKFFFFTIVKPIIVVIHEFLKISV